jgi:predicted negative regulator of RcsB-dependent stress response
MIYLALVLIGIGVWFAFEIWRAPMVDQNENIIIQGKQLKDLFKRKNK